MSDRTPVYMLDPTGATDGQGPRYDAASGRVVWADGGGGGALADLSDVDLTGVADGDRLIYDLALGKWVPGTPAGSGVLSIVPGTGISVDDTDPENPVVSATGGGGSGGGGVLLLNNGASVPTDGSVAVGTIIFEKAVASTTWSFAGLSALPSGWSRRGVASETFDASGMTASPAAGQGYAVAIPGGGSGNFTLEAGFINLSDVGVMPGVIIADSAGDGMGAVWYSGYGVLDAGVSGWQYNSSFTNTGGSMSLPNRLRLRKNGNTYYASYSLDAGATWSTEVSNTRTVTPATIGFGSIYGAASSVKVSYVRYIPAAGGGTSGLRGWWDGSAIVPF